MTGKLVDGNVAQRDSGKAQLRWNCHGGLTALSDCVGTAGSQDRNASTAAECVQVTRPTCQSIGVGIPS